MQLIVANLEKHFNSLRKNGDTVVGSSDLVNSDAPTESKPQNYWSAIGSAGHFGTVRPLKKTAAGIGYGQPSFFSPVYTPINWQIPARRRELYMWSFVNGDRITLYDATSVDASEIKEGDRVITHTGEIQTVDKVTSREVDTELYTVEYQGYYEGVSVTKGHKMLIIRSDDMLCKYFKDAKNGRRFCKDQYICRTTGCKEYEDRCLDLKEVPVEEVNEGDYVVTPIPRLVVESDIDTVEKARLLGYYCSEGSLSTDSSVSFSFCKDEAEYINEVVCLLKSCYGCNNVHLEDRPQYNVTQVTVCNKEFHDFCKKHCGSIASNKTLSYQILYANKEIQMNFLGAYWNGDGCQCCTTGNDGKLNFRTASKNLADQLVLVLARCGMPSRVSHSISKNDKEGSLMFRNSNKEELHIYTVTFGIKNSKEFHKYSSCQVYEKDGYNNDSIRIIGDNLIRRITSISSSPYKGVVYDLRVPPTYTIVCNLISICQCRFWYENEPLVATGIDFFSRFPVTGFETECSNRYVKHYFDELNKSINLDKWLRIISHEVHLLGDCFPFLEIDCPLCGGSGRVDGQICDHEGGTFKRLIVLNPDFVEVFTNSISPQEVITYLPDDELRDLVLKKGPGTDKLSPEVKALIAQGRPIPLDSACVSHLKFGESGYRRYGISMLRRMFPILSYKTKIMTAQWIVAERMILPIKVVKVGNDERPASDADISAVQAQLLATSNDPNLCIVTHHAFDLDWFGACYCSDTEVLTENGWKKYSEVSKNFDEKIAVYDPETGNMIFDIPLEYHEYDFNGDMCLFSGNRVDVCVTPNHTMLASERVWDNDKKSYEHGEFHGIIAEKVIENTRFLSKVYWEGAIPEDLPYKKIDMLSNVSLDDFLRFVGYYASEGGLKIDNGVINAVHVTQSINSKYFENIRSCMYKISDKIQEATDNRYNFPIIQFYINNSEFARQIDSCLGRNSSTKFIQSWIKNLPTEKLQILVDCMMQGDGGECFSENGKKRFRYSTVSKKLCDDFVEILIKLGADPTVFVEVVNRAGVNDIYRVNWSEMYSDRNYKTVKQRHISRQHYEGKVWCFTTSTGFFITRRNGKIAIHGNSGKILQVSSEYEFINKEVYNGFGLNEALITGNGPCYHPDVEILTENGWKYYTEVQDGEKLATFNPQNNSLEYQNFINRIVKDYDGDLIYFKTNKIDMLTTTNHRMFVQERCCVNQKDSFTDWKVVPAEEVKHRSRMRACIDNWEGEIPEQYEDGVDFGGIKVELKNFVRYLGYYISEGFASENSGSVSQKTGTDSCERIRDAFDSTGLPHASWEQKNGMTTFSIHKQQRIWLMKNVPGKVRQKFIPKWVKNLPIEYLDILLKALLDGDGSVHKNSVNTETPYNSYITGSKLLADDVMEIAFKLGYAPIISYARKESEDVYVVNIPSSNIGKFPALNTHIFGTLSEGRKCISRVPYQGKVWCFEVPNEFLIVRMNGKLLVCGNTYSSAAMGAEIMIRRLESWRLELKRWVEERIYLPIAKMRGFKEKNEWGEEEWVYPKIKWDSLNLRDRQNERQMILQLYDKGLISATRVLNEFEIDPDTEFDQIRYERIEMMGQPPPGQAAGGGMPGGGGGLGDLGGGGGISMGGGMEAPPGGEPPPMPGMEGGMAGGAPAGAPAGAPPMGAAGIREIKTAQTFPPPPSSQSTPADPSQYGGKILTPETREKLDRQRQKIQKKYNKEHHVSPEGTDSSGFARDFKGRFMMTSLEKAVIKGVEQRQRTGQINYNAFPSYEIPVGGRPLLIDIAFPDIKIAVECDGTAFHGSPEQKQRDAARDKKLNNIGWIVLRFDENEIKKNFGAVMDRIVKEIAKRENWIREERKNLAERSKKEKLG